MLSFGRTKDKKYPIMIDSLKKCQNYQKARETNKHSKAGKGFHDIQEAPTGSKVWTSIPNLSSGYISGGKFNKNT